MLKRSLFKRPKNELETYDSKHTKTASPTVPDEMCSICPSCRATLFTSDLSDNHHVCPKCGHHFRVNARQRISMTADDGTFSEMDADLQSENLIGFPHYDGKLKNARLELSLIHI